jgi:hypothetical protein
VVHSPASSLHLQNEWSIVFFPLMDKTLLVYKMTLGSPFSSDCNRLASKFLMWLLNCLNSLTLLGNLVLVTTLSLSTLCKLFSGVSLKLRYWTSVAPNLHFGSFAFSFRSLENNFSSLLRWSSGNRYYSDDNQSGVCQINVGWQKVAWLKPFLWTNLFLRMAMCRQNWGSKEHAMYKCPEVNVHCVYHHVPGSQIKPPHFLLDVPLIAQCLFWLPSPWSCGSQSWGSDATVTDAAKPEVLGLHPPRLYDLCALFWSNVIVFTCEY